MVVRAEMDAGGIGERSGKLGKLGAELAEKRELRPVHRMLGLIGAGEVAHQQARRGGGEKVGPARKLQRLMERRARAGSCRCRPGSPTARRGNAPPTPRPTRRCSEPGGDRRRESSRPSREGSRSGHRSVASGATSRTRRPSSGERHEEGAAAGCPERGNGRLDADAVGVGLDDGARLGRRRHLCEPAASSARARRDRYRSRNSERVPLWRSREGLLRAVSYATALADASTLDERERVGGCDLTMHGPCRKGDSRQHP